MNPLYVMFRKGVAASCIIKYLDIENKINYLTASKLAEYFSLWNFNDVESISMAQIRVQHGYVYDIIC
jgi:hypothetical protein